MTVSENLCKADAANVFFRRCSITLVLGRALPVRPLRSHHWQVQAFSELLKFVLVVSAAYFVTSRWSYRKNEILRDLVRMKGSLKMRLALDQLQPPLRCMAFGKERCPRVSAIAAKTYPFCRSAFTSLASLDSLRRSVLSILTVHRQELPT